jgi:hypothetical protein
MPRRGEWGRCQTKVSDMLETLGYRVEFFMLARGYWSHAHQDVMRWEAYARDAQGHQWHIGCWETMTKCIKYGIELSEDKGYPSGLMCDLKAVEEAR